MDPALKKAAIQGDVKFLETVSTQPSDYFLTRTPKDDDSTVGGNIFHVAALKGEFEFVKEAMSILPKDIQKQLLFQTDEDYDYIPLHLAACKSERNYEMVLVFKQLYASLSLSYEEDDENGLVKPWLALTVYKETALHLALKYDNENEKCAMEILAMDTEFSSCTVVDDEGNTPLYYALENGFDLVAKNILMSSLSSSTIFASTTVLTPFCCAARSSEVVLRLLFKRYGDWLDKIDDNGFTILHKWAEDGEARPCKQILKGDGFGEARTKIFKHMVFEKEKKVSDTPLHIAARKKDSELAQILIRGYQQQGSASEGEIGPPWKVQNRHGNTPLHIALFLRSKHFELALEILSIDSTMCKIQNNKGESPFFLAAGSWCTQVVDAIMEIEKPRFQMLRRNDGRTVLHALSLYRDDITMDAENTGRMLLEKYWWLINLQDDLGKTALDYAKKSNTAPWLVNLLNNPSLIDKKEFDWIEACNREETEAVLAFVNNCQDLQQACREKNDTPLHHIKLPTYEEYVNFLKNPSIAELKNTTDHDGATPLHRALKRKDMLLTKVLLLDDGVERIIPDRYGTTSMDLLADICNKNDDWEKMCQLIKVNPYLKTSYIQPGTNLDQIRNTLCVVAALLATITFAAGFTLPGGLDSNSGQAILARRVGFILFLLADVYAMCTSMLVLFCLIWSMVSGPNKALLLVDRSVYLLMNSLYGTLIAFVAGIYTVINHSAVWAAIVISVMCSILAISAKRTTLFTVIDKLVPAAANREKSVRTRLPEEETTGASSTENMTSIKIE